MKEKFISLSENITLKRSNSDIILFNITDGANYELSPDQAQLIEMLDGKHTIKQLLDTYGKSSRPVVLKLIAQLDKINAIDYSRFQKARFIQKDTVPEKRLESIHLEASGKCNMRCVHCYQAKYVKSKEYLKIQDIIKLLNDLQEMQISRISISGGEPLMMRDFKKILLLIEERDIRISAIFTNGILICEDFIGFIEKLRSKFSIFVSLDSLPGKTMYFRNLRGKLAQLKLEKILENIELLSKNNIPVVINTVVNTENINHLDEMYTIIRQLRVSSWRLGFPKMTPHFKNNSDKFNVEWIQIAEKCFKLLRNHIIIGRPFPIQIEYLFREELFSQKILELSSHDYVCDYEGRRTELCIKPNGDVVSCAYCTELPISNIKKESIRDIWYSKNTQKIKNIKIGDVEECKNCQLRNLCGTGCRANAFFLHGNFEDSKDDYACMAVSFFKDKVMPLLKQHGIIE